MIESLNFLVVWKWYREDTTLKKDTNVTQIYQPEPEFGKECTLKVLMMLDLSRAALSGLVTACKREWAHDNAAVNGNANAAQNYPKIRPSRAQAMRGRKPIDEKEREHKIFPS